MDPLPKRISSLAARVALPDPDDVTDPKSTVTLGTEQIRSIGLLISALVDYITIQYARCAEKAATPR